MPKIFDYRCESCGLGFEAIYATADEPAEMFLACPSCSGRSPRVFAGGYAVGNKSKGIFPAYDPQTGMTFQSRQSMERWAKKQGGMWMGPQEFNRTAKASKVKNPEETIEKTALHAAMEEAYAEEVKGNRTAHTIVDAQDFKYVESKE
jgi:putative FmdB family regulatory protein